jgi:AAA+ ATPase superfamily predicted ATPase
MRFYNREEELEILAKNREQSANQSVMTTLIGRRRTGKTSLLLKSVEGTRHLYLYVSKDNEQMLCKKFQEQATAALGVQIFGQTSSFGELFEQLMRYGTDNNYTLIIDEFQNFLSINKSIPSSIQDVWDRYKDRARVNLILCGSIYSMMKRIFENGDEPLYGRRDSNMRLLPFSISTLKQILADHNPNYVAEDLLCLYMLTGGVAKYVALLMDAKATTKDKMLRCALAPDSPFLSEGTELLVSEFGRDYGTYFSILQLIAGGMTTQSEIDSIIGKNTGAYLNNLHVDYTFISKNTPILSKPGARNIKWQIDDPFLRFWFRFVYPYQGLIESNRTELLVQYVSDNYAQYTGKTLERLFHDRMWQSGQYTRIGNWWDKKGEQEIDMVALNEFDKTCVIAEIKRNPKKLSLSNLETKAATLSSEIKEYSIKYQLLSLEDILK